MHFSSLLAALLFNWFWVNAASADNCANFVADSYFNEGVSIETYEIPRNSDLSEIANVLHNNTIDLNTVATPAYDYIYDLSINISVAGTDKAYPAEIYPGRMTGKLYIPKFSVEYQGFFVPPETGDYTFTIDNVGSGGGAAIYIFDNLDMYCCDDTDNTAWLSKTSQVTYIPSDSKYQTQSMTVNLQGGHGVFD